MLNLDDTARTRLRATGTLIVDEDGDEVLVGLTVAESQFLLSFEEDPGYRLATAETYLYFELKHKHLLARCARFHTALAPPDNPENEMPP